jgi:hypothetical protein
MQFLQWALAADAEDGNKELVRRLYGGLMAKGDIAVADPGVGRRLPRPRHPGRRRRVDDWKEIHTFRCAGGRIDAGA